MATESLPFSVLRHLAFPVDYDGSGTAMDADVIATLPGAPEPHSTGPPASEGYSDSCFTTFANPAMAAVKRTHPEIMLTYIRT